MCQCENLLSLKLRDKFGVKFGPAVLSGDKLLSKFQSIVSNVKELRQFKKESKTPICVVKFKRDCPVKELFAKLWRVTNNIDALRDIYAKGEHFCVDATSKDELEGYTCGRPMQTDCKREVVADLVRRGVVKDEPELFYKFEIFG